MKTWKFASTILEQLGHIWSILGACNLGAEIKDLYTSAWKKKLNSL